MASTPVGVAAPIPRAALRRAVAALAPVEPYAVDPTAVPRPIGVPLLSGFPGPLTFAWLQIWPPDDPAGLVGDNTAAIRIRGYRATNQGVAAKPSCDRTFTFKVYGLTVDAILDLIARTLDDDWLDFMCKRYPYDPAMLQLQLPSFSIQVDGVVS